MVAEKRSVCLHGLIDDWMTLRQSGSTRRTLPPPPPPPPPPFTHRFIQRRSRRPINHHTKANGGGGAPIGGQEREELAQSRRERWIKQAIRFIENEETKCCYEPSMVVLQEAAAAAEAAHQQTSRISAIHPVGGGRVSSCLQEEVDEPPWRADNNVRPFGKQLALLGTLHASHDQGHARGYGRPQSTELLRDLHRQFSLWTIVLLLLWSVFSFKKPRRGQGGVFIHSAVPGGGKDESKNAVRLLGETLKDRQRKGSSFARAGLSTADDIATSKDGRDTARLHQRGHHQPELLARSSQP